MVVGKTLTAWALSAALTLAPACVYAQSQATKTGTGSEAGVTAGQGGLGELTPTQIALLAALGIGLVAIGFAITNDDDDDDVPDDTPATSTATTTSTN